MQGKRISVRRNGTENEAAAWSAVFRSGRDRHGELAPFGLNNRAAVEKAAPEAWRRYRALFLRRLLVRERRFSECWALQKFGEPPRVDSVLRRAVAAAIGKIE
jgi:hypothetical protein